MYNTDFPTRAELPSRAKLRRSTFIAAASAAVLLVTVVFPSEYGFDPTGVGNILGLKRMGEIKTQLASEAEADRAKAEQSAGISSSAGVLASIERRLGGIEQQLATQRMAAVMSESEAAQTEIGLEPADAIETASTDLVVVPPKPAAAEEEAATEVALAAPAARNDEVSLTLEPGQGTEVKLVMAAGAKANFAWTANGSVLNVDTHGEGDGEKVSYEKGRGVASDEGVLEASFAGTHGWFWRNRTAEPVTLTLQTKGDYEELKRIK